MPKKTDLGRSIMRAVKRSTAPIKGGYRHSSDPPDMNSVTEQTRIDAFMEFKFVDPSQQEGEKISVLALEQHENEEYLCIPRRPDWGSNTSKEELDAKERQSFLAWREKLSKFQTDEHIQLTPYEKNLEVWRQLWRVIERSDIIVQIIDARNPLLFRCPDLEDYIKDIDTKKKNVLLLNKADFLTVFQRECWCDYFDQAGVQIAFFSALEQMNHFPENKDDSEPDKDSNFKENVDSAYIKNSPKILTRDDLVSFLKSVPHSRARDNMTTIGLVGYPNAGKSSTINAILMSKKVSASATPGKTKHFQTHIIEQDLCLCDCPGLVFPNVVSTKAEMVINGMLSIDNLTNWMQPISLVTSLIPKHILQSTYSILIPAPGEGKSSKSSTAEEFLNAHGYNRGFMTQRGLPDNARSARYILKDFVNGKLLYCHAPPGMKQEDFHQFPEVKPKKLAVKSENTEKKSTLTEADMQFFTKLYDTHVKGNGAMKPQDAELTEKPWKKHHNRNKKEKLRRIYKNHYE